MIRLQNKIFSFALLVMLLNPSAHAVTGQDVGILMGGNYSNPNLNNSQGSASQSTLPTTEFGTYYNLEFQPEYSLETSLLFYDRKFDQQSVTYNYSNAKITPLFRYWVMPGVGLGVGPYYSRGYGNLNSNNGSPSQTLSSAGLKSDDFGGIASLQMKVPLFGRIQPILDLRYDYGLTNLNSSGQGSSSNTTRDFQVLLGVGYFLD